MGVKRIEWQRKTSFQFLKFTAHEFLKDLKENHHVVLAIFEVNKKEREH